MCAFEVDYADMDALLVTAGVVSALVLSFSISLNFTLTPEDYTKFTFNKLVQRQEFRRFAVDVMDQEYVECRDACETEGAGALCLADCRKQKFDWIFTDYVAGTTWDLREAMLVGGDIGDGESQPLTEAAMQLLFPIFPMEKMLAWSSVQSLESPNHHPSQEIMILTWWTTVFLGSALVSSIVLYILLQLSSAREGGNDHRFWVKYGTPFIMLTYVFIAIGIILQVRGASRIEYGRSVDPRLSKRLWMAPERAGYAFISIILLYGIVLKFIAPLLQESRREPKNAPDCEAAEGILPGAEGAVA